jgi:hypothetical protein
MRGKKVDYLEIWFTYFDGDQRKEGVAWKIKNILLGSGVNPNFNYTGDVAKSNFFDHPRKPYVIFPFLTNGEWVMDNTSLTEQAASQQDILEKRGRQIVENADKANSTKVFNLNMIDAAAVEKYTEDPSQSITVKGDVRMAFARVPPPNLPRYVIQDKFDARSEIDNIFGTHAPFRGEKTDSPTLGQEVLSQRADLGRTKPLTDAIERGATEVYKGMTQLYKVFAEEEHIVKYVGADGGTVHAAFSRDKIEDGIELHIQAGSMEADDKTQDKNEAIELMKMGGRIDPLSMFEKLHVPNPIEWAKRVIYHQWLPDKYIKEVLKLGDDAGDQEAMSNIQRINSGENVPPKADASKEYLATYRNFMESPGFKQIDPEVQRLHVEHLRGTTEAAKSALGGKPQEQQKQPGGGIFNRIRSAFGGR